MALSAHIIKWSKYKYNFRTCWIQGLTQCVLSKDFLLYCALSFYFCYFLHKEDYLYSLSTPLSPISWRLIFKLNRKIFSSLKIKKKKKRKKKKLSGIFLVLIGLVLAISLSLNQALKLREVKLWLANLVTYSTPGTKNGVSFTVPRKTKDDVFRTWEIFFFFLNLSDLNKRRRVECWAARKYQYSR